MSVLNIILAIIFPPLPVALHYGVSQQLFINILLTLLGFIPGIIHAFIVLRKVS